ncbi:helicase superfamily c-terminal domain [Rhizoctonia solani]|uniref:Helicase superfamily c-terminal domain n=1 Tax=Rhizoctonia solani TaxID=456999 RepID=A0A8H7M1U0_9AGAM|nr:helicase superfamily c-terminal domain [Rhizoctonia solani]
MSSSAELSKPNNRAAALAQLKFKRKKDVQPGGVAAPVPAPPETPRVGRVLVPDSSPLAPHNQPKPSGTEAWSRLADDGLSAPSFSSSSKYFSPRPILSSISTLTRTSTVHARSHVPILSAYGALRRVPMSLSPPVSLLVPCVHSLDSDPCPEDPLSPVVGKLRKDVSKVNMAAESDDDDVGHRRRVFRGRKQVDDDDLPSPKNIIKRTLEDDNDEREGIVHIPDTPPPTKYVNGKALVSMAHTRTGHPNHPFDYKPAKFTSDTKQTESKDGNVSSGTEFDADGDSEPEGEWVGDEETQRLENEALVWFNIAAEDALVEVTACTPAQASLIASLRPFTDVPSLKRSLKRTKGVTPRFFDDYVNMQRGYSDVDTVLAGFEVIGKQLASIISEWTGGQGATDDDAGLHLITVPSLSQSTPTPAVAATATAATTTTSESLSYLIRRQPHLLAPGVVLKDYQLFGISWLNLLYKKQLSCILADEMGLGKTSESGWDGDEVEVLGERVKGVHLVVVPSSTLENWAREFAKFAPSIRVATYYGNQKDRAGFRDEYKRAVRRAERMGIERDDVDPGWDVLITTYQLAQGAEPDRKFLSKSVKWETCVFDEGHVLKNFQSQRYQQLMKIQARWRLLLTGTPLQNNLQELVVCLHLVSSEGAYMTNYLAVSHFVHPPREIQRRNDRFAPYDIQSPGRRACKFAFSRTGQSSQDYDDAVCVAEEKGSSPQRPPEQNRKNRLVLNDRPPTVHLQRTMRRSKKELEREAAAASASASTPPPTKNDQDESSRSVERTRADGPAQAASHPMLFRRRFDDGIIRKMAKMCLKEPEFMDSVEELVVEDMEVMTDAELQVFAKRYKSCRKMALQDECFLDAGKVEVLLELVKGYQTDGRRVLVFSQFTQILDILKVVLDHVGLKFLVLTGSTPVDERQSLVDKFTEDETIPVFLLSTRAGGMGINLTAASGSGLFVEAADRSYRIGQKRDVDVVKLITKETIEEDILRLGQTKLALDEAVAGDQAEEGDEGATEKAMKSSLEVWNGRNKGPGPSAQVRVQSGSVLSLTASGVNKPSSLEVAFRKTRSERWTPCAPHHPTRTRTSVQTPPSPNTATDGECRADLTETLEIDPDCWGLLVPCSAGQPSGIIQLKKKPDNDAKQASWPRSAVEEHSFKIGRGSSNDVILPGQKISQSRPLPSLSSLLTSFPGSQHCTLTWSGRSGDKPGKDNAVVVHDNSSNGTFINGKRIGKTKKSLLTPGDELSFGLPGQDLDDLDYRAYWFRIVPCSRIRSAVGAMRWSGQR